MYAKYLPSIVKHKLCPNLSLRYQTGFSSEKPLKVSQIPYSSQNMKFLPQILCLRPNKSVLKSMVTKSNEQICPNAILPAAKKYFNDLQSAQLRDLYSYIKEKILQEKDTQLNEDFTKRAHYYFMKQGKKVRPSMIVLLAENFKEIVKAAYPEQDFNVQFKKIDENIRKWSSLIQIMHIASLAHDDIVDDSPSRRGQQSQHLKYGSKIAVFSGNYIISKASKTVSEFGSPRLYEIYANTMSSLAQGEIKQLIAKGQNKFVNQKGDGQKMVGFNKMIEKYMQKSYFKSAALMCGSLIGVPTIFQLSLGNLFGNSLKKQLSQIELISFKAGQHYGLALQLIDDILDYISTAEEMGKEEMSDLIQGNVTAPVYFSYLHTQFIKENGGGLSLQMLNKKKKNKQDALIVKRWVDESVGIQLTYLLGSMHVGNGIKQLDRFSQNIQNQEVRKRQLLGWRYLGHKLMTRRK